MLILWCQGKVEPLAMTITRDRDVGLLIVLGLLVALAALAAPCPLQAQTLGLSTADQTQSRYLTEEDRTVDQHTAFLGLASQYTEAVMIGLLTGGLVMNRLIGGSVATMTGTAAGTLFACWLYLKQAENTYIVREVY